MGARFVGCSGDGRGCGQLVGEQRSARALRKYHTLELDGGGLGVMKLATGTAVLTAMKRKGHGADRLGVAPSSTAEALQYIVTYVVPTTPPLFDGGVLRKRRRTSRTRPGRRRLKQDLAKRQLADREAGQCLDLRSYRLNICDNTHPSAIFFLKMGCPLP